MPWSSRWARRVPWKVLRVLGNMLGLPSFEYESASEVLADARGAADAQQPLVQGKLLSNKTAKAAWLATPTRSRSRLLSGSIPSCAARLRCSSRPMRARATTLRQCDG